MTFALEYHTDVRRLIPASLALLGMFFVPSLLSASSAQVSSATSSAASSGSHSSPGARSTNSPNIGSAGHLGHGPSNMGAASSTSAPHSTHVSNGNNGGNKGRPRQHSGNTGVVYYPYFYAWPVPYVVDNTNNDAGAPDDDNDAEYQGGPTIFDRGGSGPESNVPPSQTPDQAQYEDQDATADVPDSESPQVLTTLVFKDGHQLEIDNYAIVSQTLYDLTPGHTRKIALADLDLPATEKQNDDRGVSFQLPPSPQAN